MKKITVMIMAVLFLAQGLAFAEAVSGKVAKVDLEAKQVVVSLTDAQTGATEEKSVTVGDDTEYVGVAALSDVQVGDEVNVAAEADETTGELVAVFLEVVNAEASPTL